MQPKICFYDPEQIPDLDSRLSPSPEDLLVLFEMVRERQEMDWDTFVAMLRGTSHDNT